MATLLQKKIKERIKKSLTKYPDAPLPCVKSYMGRSLIARTIVDEDEQSFKILQVSCLNENYPK